VQTCCFFCDVLSFVSVSHGRLLSVLVMAGYCQCKSWPVIVSVSHGRLLSVSVMAGYCQYKSWPAMLMNCARYV